ncbi:MAG TPA: hypothetical protein VFS43_00100 [Polyangiaceae bacterium]|nr:hypothetical protein [Polyangiaceae bacterium]
MNFSKIEFIRRHGTQDRAPDFVREINRLTALACAAPVPIEETYARLAEANLGHFVYRTQGGERTLIAYSLNQVFDVTLRGRPHTVNYFCSAFLMPNLQARFSLYHYLGSLRITGRETYLMVRTQNPVVISFFTRFCRLYRCRVYTPLSKRLPSDVTELVRARFAQEGLIYRGVYGRPLTGSPVPARGGLSRRVMALLEPSRGDACVLVAKRLARPSTVFPPADSVAPAPVSATRIPALRAPAAPRLTAADFGLSSTPEAWPGAPPLPGPSPFARPPGRVLTFPAAKPVRMPSDPPPTPRVADRR